MTRRAPRKKTSSDSAIPAQPANHCRAVIWVDGAAIRKKVKKDYEKALRDLANARQQLDRFEKTDQPEFTRWLHSHLGALLTELRELTQKLAADESLVFMVENEVMFGGGSHARAYRRVMEMRENPKPPPPHSDEPDGEWSGTGARPESEDQDGGDDPFKEFFDQVFGDFWEDEGPQDSRGPRFGRQPESRPTPPASARLKELYRKLVRRLHPDTQREMTTQKTEWWHQAQTAYEEGDVEKLEVILTLCEIGDNGTIAHTSASLLQRITAQLKSSLRGLKRQITAQRREPAWNFSQRTDHESMLQHLRRELLESLEPMRFQAKAFEAMIDRWKAGAERLKQPRRRKRQPQNPEFQF